jgi:hypothetical protein
LPLRGYDRPLLRRDSVFRAAVALTETDIVYRGAKVRAPAPAVTNRL